MYGNFKTNKINSVSGNMVLHKRYTATYRPWLINLTVDCCEMLRDENYHAWGNAAFRFIVRIIRSIYPSVFNGCPFEVRKLCQKKSFNV